MDNERYTSLHKTQTKLFKTHYLTNDPIKVRKYKTYSNKLNKLKEIAGNNYLKNKIALNSGNMKATWKIIGMVINRKKSSSQLILTKLLYRNKLFNNLVAEGEVITSLYSLSRRRSEYRLVITEPEATNSFSINFQVFTNNNPHNFIKIHFK
jgi:hypothetical protein